MAHYEIPKDMVAVHDKMLVPGVIDVIRFGGDRQTVEVLSDGAAAIYVSTNGVEPTVSGPHTYVLPASPSKRTLSHRGNESLMLISPGSPTYSITVL